MNFQRAKRKRPQIELVPMIDIIFFLVIFFMLFTTLKTTSDGIDIDLPKAAASTVNDRSSSVTVTIEKSGLMYYEGRLVDKVALTSHLSENIKKDPDTLVIIRGDKGVIYERIVDVMDIVGKVGGKKFTFAVEKVSR